MNNTFTEEWKNDFIYYLISKYGCENKHANQEYDAWVEMNSELVSDTEPQDAADECVDAWCGCM